MQKRLLLLIVLAALFGAPSHATATGDGISDPPASPGAGKQDADDGPLSGEGPLVLVVLAGLMAMASVALVGSATLVAGRRRRAETGGGTEGAPASDMTSVLERRTVRRAKLRLDDDPIVAALGVGRATDRARPRRRPRPVTPGVSESDGRSVRS